MSLSLHGVDVLIGQYVAPMDAATEAVAQQVIAELEAERPRFRVLESQIPGVSDEQWTEFALAMKTADQRSSADNALGMFQMKPRRLADLGLMTNVRSSRSLTGRMAWKGDWVAPLTERKFLESAAEQYNAFGASMRRYVAGLEDGSVAQPESGVPTDMTMSGALAVLHRCGPNGLIRWCSGDRFPETEALFEAVNGIF